jgi:hypothetical protein
VIRKYGKKIGGQPRLTCIYILKYNTIFLPRRSFLDMTRQPLMLSKPEPIQKIPGHHYNILSSRIHFFYIMYAFYHVFPYLCNYVIRRTPWRSPAVTCKYICRQFKAQTHHLVAKTISMYICILGSFSAQGLV